MVIYKGSQRRSSGPKQLQEDFTSGLSAEYRMVRASCKMETLNTCYYFYQLERSKDVQQISEHLPNDTMSSASFFFLHQVSFLSFTNKVTAKP